MSKWICVTKDFSKFTYGKVYDGEVNMSGTLLDVPNDLGERTYPALYGVEPIIRMMEVRSFGQPTKKVYYFLTLEEWREKQINQIID